MPLTDPKDFQEWKDQPLTQEYLAYLKGRQFRLMEAWGEGQDLPVEMQAQAVLLGRLSMVRFDDIAEHFKIGEFEEKDDG